MPCDGVQECLLDLDADASARQRLSEALRHLETCADCRAALADFDRIRHALAGAGAPDTDTDTDADADADATPEASRWRPPERPPHTGTPGLRLPFRHFNRTLAIAASLLLGVLLFELGRHTTPTATGPGRQIVHNPPPAPASEPSPAAFAPRELSHELAAFHQVSQVFDGRAGWIMTSQQHDSDMGMGGVGVIGQRKVLLLRLVLTRAGSVVSNADLLVIAGEKADLKIPLRQGESLHYRIGTSADEPTRLTLTLELEKPHGGELLAAMTTSLRLEPGERVTAGRLATSAGEYELNLGFTRTTLDGETR